MNDVEYINFLNSYTMSASTVELIKNSEAIKEATVPMYWKNALASSNHDECKKIILDQWKKYSHKELSNTISYLEQYLKKVELIYIDKEFSLLYTITSYQTSKNLVYEGKNPMHSLAISEEDIRNDWATIDQ